MRRRWAAVVEGLRLRWHILLLVYVACVSSPNRAWAGIDKDSSLRGASSVCVDVKLVGGASVEEWASIGVTENNIGADAETFLRKAGIKVVSTATWRDDLRSLKLEINVEALAVRAENGTLLGWAVFTQVSAREDMSLVRRPEMVRSVVTWSRDILSFASPHSQATIPRVINSLVKQFADDFADVNSK